MVTAVYGNRNENFFIAMYYAGHGTMMTNVTAVLNEKKNYELESRMRALAKERNAYVLACYDCCRVKSQERGHDAESEQRMVNVYACKPGAKTPAESSMANVLFEEILGDDPPFPYNLVGFAGADGKGETHILTKETLKLQLNN